MNQLLVSRTMSIVCTLVFGHVISADEVGISPTKPTSGVFVEIDGKFMIPYVDRIPGTDVTFEMVPVPGGTFLMGSPSDEPDRDESEGPQFNVAVAPLWVCKHEVKWEEYDQFRDLYQTFTMFDIRRIRSAKDNLIDSVTAPTPLHEPTFTFEFGHEPKQSAVSMTMYAAQHYTKWLSAISGRQYRLPTEAEWEYACRAGTQTAYSWGDSAADAEDFAWYFDTAGDEGQQAGGGKQANAFGLHDMHGNVAEWTVNAHTDDYASYASKQPIQATEVVSWPTKTVSGSVMRGGTWQDDPDKIRSAARLVSDDEAWKEEDPNDPKSPWWFTADQTRGVGFRVFRSYADLEETQIRRFWDNPAEDVADQVYDRVDIDGRGKRGLVDADLPTAIKQLD